MSPEPEKVSAPEVQLTIYDPQDITKFKHDPDSAISGGIEMPKSIEVVYEGGVLKPLSPLELKEHEKVRITLEEAKSAVRVSSGMFSGLDESTINEIALSAEFLPEEA